MTHEPECRSNCPCCAVDWDCTCGATFKQGYGAMTHDPLCPGWFDTMNGQAECEACELIAKVRQDEQAKAGIRQAQPSWKFPFTATVTVRPPMNNYREHL